jgi:hypothetical protein
MSNEAPNSTPAPESEMLKTVNGRIHVGRYWREILASAWNETELFSWGKMLTTLGISVAAFGLQWAIGVRTFYVTLQIIGTVIVAYLAVGTVAFLWKLLRVPAVRDERQRAEITKLEADLATERNNIQELEQAHTMSLQKKTKQDLSIKQERVWLEKILLSDESSLVYWDVTISLYITNRHEADNAIRGYGLIVVLPNGQELEGEIGSASRLVSRRTGEELIDLKSSLDVPLKRGHPKRGAVRFRFSSNDRDFNLAGMDYVLRIQDVYDVAHKPKGKLPEPGDDLHWKLPDKAFGG